MKNKKIVLGSIILLFSTAFLSVAAEISIKDIKAYLNYGIQILYNGQNQLMYDANGAQVYPITYNGTTYIPVRAVSTIFGQSIAWDETNNSVLLGEDAMEFNKKIEESLPKSSTKSSPLKINDWGIASKYDTETKTYKDINIQLSSVSRGSDAEKIVKEWCENSSNSSVEYQGNLDEGMEWLVVNYNVDLTNMSKSEVGNTSIVLATLTSNSEKYTPLLYNNTLYTIKTTTLGSSTPTSDNTSSNCFAAQIPIGCTDYLIQMGDLNQTNAYFKGI